MAYTRHGHHIPGTILGDEPQPQSRARCGGPSMCKVCKQEAAAHHEAKLKNETPLTFDRSDHPKEIASKMVKSYVYARFSTIFGRPEFDVEFAWFMQNGKSWEAILQTTLDDNKLFEVKYSSEEKKTRIVEYRAIEEVEVPDSAIF